MRVFAVVGIFWEFIFNRSLIYDRGGKLYGSVVFSWLSGFA